MSDKDVETVARERIEQQRESNSRLGQCMAGVLAYCRELNDAIANHDFEAVEGLARNAAKMWLDGQAACRRLVAQSRRPSPLTHAACEAVEDTYKTLLAHFQHAIDVIAVPRMKRTLDAQRATMTAARAQPLA